ncbi:hypothetical protein LCGC14_2120770 [marine sediment metagenome]|uniref:Uncharacterized protein n=1 Tax=marine sediment metagenome TaxID=412755 RepID=A0A0F9H0M4_9ZZZZ
MNRKKRERAKLLAGTPSEFKLGDCASCHDSDVLLTLSDDEENPLSYVCKECFLRGY